MKILSKLTFAILCSVSALSQTQKELLEVTAQLEYIYITDQEPRIALDSIIAKYGHNSDEVKKHWEIIRINDSLNTLVVTDILDKYGWLSKEQSSPNANSALFLVIQHADIAVQLKYKPLLYEAVKLGKANATQYALLLDRTNMRQDKLQIYGSQVSVFGNAPAQFFPIADEPNVNIRRKEIGLNSLEEYAKQFNLTYTIPEVDTLKGKLVILGYVMDIKQTPINNVSISINGKKYATSDMNGAYRFTIDTNTKFDFIDYTLNGFVTTNLPVKKEGKEVMKLNVIMRAVQ